MIVMPPSTRHLIASLTLLFSLEAHARVFRSDSGDTRLIGLKMEQQANRGFCAPATMASVMRYHGIDIDQARIAHEANSTDDTGTDVEAMLSVIARSSDDNGLAIETIAGFNYARYKRTILRYNALAKSQGSPKLWFTDSGSLDLSRTFNNADIDLLRRTATKQEIAKFTRSVGAAIDANTPLIWGVVLGIAPETALSPYSRGGHLRLITGINRDTNEILYSDPWGPGHANKRMPLDNAFAITMSLHRLRPTSRQNRP